MNEVERIDKHTVSIASENEEELFFDEVMRETLRHLASGNNLFQNSIYETLKEQAMLDSKDDDSNLQVTLLEETTDQQMSIEDGAVQQESFQIQANDIVVERGYLHEIQGIEEQLRQA